MQRLRRELVLVRHQHNIIGLVADGGVDVRADVRLQLLPRGGRALDDLLDAVTQRVDGLLVCA